MSDNNRLSFREIIDPRMPTREGLEYAQARARVKIGVELFDTLRSLRTPAAVTLKEEIREIPDYFMEHENPTHELYYRVTVCPVKRETVKFPEPIKPTLKSRLKYLFTGKL